MVTAQESWNVQSLAARSFEAVIFDLDQTLVDSTAALGAAWGTWLAEYGITPDPSRNWGGWTSEDIVRACLDGESDVAGGIARIDELETTTTDGILALPGAADALQVLPAGRVAIGTSGTAAVARARLAAAGLPVPAVLVSASDVEHGKPAPDIFLAAARQLGVEPTRCLVVEDSPTGLAAARAMGAATLAVLTSTARHQLGADAGVPDLSHICWLVGPDGIRLVERPAPGQDEP